MENPMKNDERTIGQVLKYPLLLIVIAMVTWYIKHRWENKKIYELLEKMKQPPSLPIFGHCLQFLTTPRQIFKLITKLFFEYGPNFAVRFLHLSMIIIGKPEDLETILQSQYCVEKSYVYEFTQMVVGEGVFSAPVKKWKRNRKLIQPTFNSRILENFIPIFGATSTICVNETLPKYLGRTNIDWYSVFTSVNLDTISQTAMGVNTDAQRKVVPFSKHLETSMRVVFLRFFNVFLHPRFIFSWTNLYKELKASTNYINGFTDKVVQDKKLEFKEKLKEGTIDAPIEDGPIKKKVFLEMLLDIDHKGMTFTDIELRDEVNTFFVGGTDTSAVTSCFFLTMMGMHQDIQQKVYEECMEVLGPERYPETEDLPKLMLLERCLKETMRLFSPAPFISRVVHGKEVELSDITLPVGAFLLLPIFYTHRCSDYWEEPLKFNPDRFLPEEVAKRHPFTFLPFSGGLRGCLGMRYSYMNLKVLQSMILRRYKVYCDEYKSVEDIELKNYIVLRPAHGFKFYLERRAS